MSVSEEKRFDSWKEIATFLGRDLRTVRRWEAERGLPVHRVPGNGRHAVFAYKSEIEAWLKSAEDPSDDGESSKDTKRNAEGIAGHSRAIFWGVCAIVIVVLAGYGIAGHMFDRHLTRIERVSPIYAATNQGIIIDGEGFGSPPKTIRISPDGGVDTYGESYSTSLRIDDLGEGRHHWVAGRGGPLNYCDISVKLASWTNSRIVLAGFAGPLGISCTDRYQVAPGDKLRIIIWGPQNRCGPGGPSQCPDEVKAGRIATFETVVRPSQDIQVPACR